MTRRIDLLGRYARLGYSTRCTFTGCSAPPSSTDSTVTVMGPLIITSSALIWSLLGTVVVVMSTSELHLGLVVRLADPPRGDVGGEGVVAVAGPCVRRQALGVDATRLRCEVTCNEACDLVELMYGHEVWGDLLHDDEHHRDALTRGPFDDVEVVRLLDRVAVLRGLSAESDGRRAAGGRLDVGGGGCEEVEAGPARDARLRVGGERGHLEAGVGLLEDSARALMGENGLDHCVDAGAAGLV